MKVKDTVKFGFSTAIVVGETSEHWILCKRVVVGEDWEIVKYAKFGMPELKVVQS